MRRRRTRRIDDDEEDEEEDEEKGRKDLDAQALHNFLAAAVDCRVLDGACIALDLMMTGMRSLW